MAIDVPQRNRIFTKEQLVEIFRNVSGHTLGEVDVQDVFRYARANPLIKGIAGDVIEQSVLGYDKDRDQRPDIIVDGEWTEVKTTGIRQVGGTDNPRYEAKEPVSITAVSIGRIEKETFDTSNFWHKLEHLLFVFYLYASREIVQSIEYKDFPILGGGLLEFSDTDKEKLRNDWLTVQKFLQNIRDNYHTEEERKEQYPRLSSELRHTLMLIDTAPKYPHPPRFRLKRVFVSTIYNDYFNVGARFLHLDEPVNTYADIDRRCHEIAETLRGKTVEELYNMYDIGLGYNSKARGEQIVIRMFGQQCSKLSDISDFAEIGLLAKNITMTSRGTKKEDMKFETIDFSEWLNNSISYEDSYLYSYFSEHSFIFVIFQQTDGNPKNDIFCGFKRFTFSEDFILTEPKRTWEEVRDLVWNNRLQIVQALNKEGMPIVNPSGSIQEAPNFPKKGRIGSERHIVFLRGSGTDSSDRYKTLELNGLRMLPQCFWIDGTYINQQLDNIDYL